MARRTKEDTEKTYHALLDAATAIFSEQGVSKTTLNEIAKAAGMTRGAVYWHFENKDAVIKALWERNAGEKTEGFIAAISSLPSEKPLEHFKTQLKAILIQAFTDPRLIQSLRIIHSSKEFTEQESELQVFLRGRRERFYKAFAAAIGSLQQSNAINKSYATEFVTNSVWIFITGLLEAQLHMDKMDLLPHCSDHIDLLLKPFEA